jgi:serine/threonine-protein kinase
MSPEQMRSAKNADARSDVWSVGVVLYELVTGRLPFESSSLPDLLAQILQGNPAPLATHRPDVPPAFEAIVRRCLQRDRNARAQDVSEIASALAPYAPPRAKPVADRIAVLLGGEPPTLPVGATRSMLARPEAPPAPAPGEGATLVTVAPAVTTATPSRIKGVLGIVLGAIVVGIALGSGAYLWSRRAQAPQPAARPDVTAPAPTAAASEVTRSRKGLPPARGGRPAPRNTAATDAPAAKGGVDDRSGAAIAEDDAGKPSL